MTGVPARRSLVESWSRYLHVLQDECVLYSAVDAGQVSVLKSTVGQGVRPHHTLSGITVDKADL